MRTLAMLAVTALLVTGCANEEPATTPNDSIGSTPPTRTVDPSHTGSDVPTGEPSDLPAGYPKVVAVTDLPEQVQEIYTGKYKRAVALAPDLWTPMPPGSTIDEAVTSGTADGTCEAKESYEKSNLDGRKLGGTCW